MTIPERAALCVAGILLILPGWPSNFAGMGIALALWALRKLQTGRDRPGGQKSA